VNFQIGLRTFFERTSLNQVADSLRIERDRIDEALEWTPEQTRAWLSQYPAEVLKSRPALRKFTEWKPSRPAQPAAGA
jgi:hypothetical protein